MDELRKALPDMDTPPEQPDSQMDDQPETNADEVGKDHGQIVLKDRASTVVDAVYQPGLDDPSLPINSLPDFEYGPLLPEGYIRILILMPPTNEDSPEELSWALVCDTLANAKGKYSAVSYTWGDTAKTHRIRCNGKSLAVTENVHDAVKNLVGLFNGNFAVKGTPALWIDAVCINQHNFAEREEQVKMMRDIYKAAQMTFIWLPVGRGASDEDLEKIDKGFTSMAMLREMYYVQQFRDMLHNGKVSFDTLDHMKYGEKELRVPWDNRDGITKLFTQPWFERIWICQEIAVSGNAAVFDGRHIAPWGLFADSAEIVHHLGGLDSFRIWKSNQVAHDKTFVGNVRRLEKLRKGVTQDTQTGLLELLHSTANFQSTEPLDRVYGLLGLITEERDRDIVTSFLDYTISPYLLYLNLTINHIIEHQTLDILHLIGPVKTDPAGKWLSLVPNLAATNNHKRGLGTFKSREEWIYHASLDTKPELKVNGQVPKPGEIIKVTDVDEISLSGVVLDRVTRVSKMLDSAGMSMTTMLTWFETAMFAKSSSRFIPGAMLKRHLEYLTKRRRRGVEGLEGKAEAEAEAETGKAIEGGEDDVGEEGEKESGGEMKLDTFVNKEKNEKDEEKNIDKEILTLLEPLVEYDEEGNATLPGAEEPKTNTKGLPEPDTKADSLPTSGELNQSEEPPADNKKSAGTPSGGNRAGACNTVEREAGNNHTVDNTTVDNNTANDNATDNETGNASENTSDNTTSNNAPPPTTKDTTTTAPPPPSPSKANNPSSPQPESLPSTGIGSQSYPLPPHESYTKSFFRTLLHNINPLSPDTLSSSHEAKPSAAPCACASHSPGPSSPDPKPTTSSNSPSISTLFTQYCIPWFSLLQSHDGDSFNHAWMREWYAEHAMHEGTKPVTTFAKWVEDSQLGRRMFRTGKGFIGTGVDGMVEGDLVVLLRGGQTVYVVREVTGGRCDENDEVEAKNTGVGGAEGVDAVEKEAETERSNRGARRKTNKYKFVGAAYMHGFMEGEGINIGVEEEFVFV